MNDKRLKLLGLMKKAGAIDCTEQNCRKSIIEEKAHLILVASDASIISSAKITQLSLNHNIRVIHTEFSNSDLSTAIGRSSCAYIAINDKGFADSFLKLVM